MNIMNIRRLETTKKITVYEVKKFDPFSPDCMYCNRKGDCKRTDSKICLLDSAFEKKDDPCQLDTAGYKWVVMYRDHYRGNGKGEYFLAQDYPKLLEKQRYLFNNEDRPVHTIILTNEDVPSMVEKRRVLINLLTKKNDDIRTLARPKKNFDGRKTRRTAPQEYAEYDKQINDYNAKISKLHGEILEIYAKMKPLQFSSTLLRIYTPTI